MKEQIRGKEEGNEESRSGKGQVEKAERATTEKSVFGRSRVTINGIWMEACVR